MSDAGLITFAISMHALPVLTSFIRLDTEIDNEHIKFNFVPFFKEVSRLEKH